MEHHASFDGERVLSFNGILIEVPIQSLSAIPNVKL